MQSVVINKMQPNDECEIIFNGVDMSLMCALRRTFLNDTPVLGIEDVHIKKNTSPMPDDVLKHRIGLLPIQSSHLDRMIMHVSCGCHSGVCDKCGIQLHMRVQCPIDNRQLLVSSDSLLPDQPSAVIPRDVAIVLLGCQQEIDVVCIARLGFGKYHAWWIPCCGVAIKPLPDVRIDPAGLSPADRQQLVDLWPKRVFSICRDIEDIQVENSHACNYCAQCDQYKMIHKGYTIVGTDKLVIRLCMEYTGTLNLDKVVVKGISALYDRLQKCLQALCNHDNHDMC